MEEIEKLDLRHRARRYSMKDGIFVSARNSFGNNYIAPFAIAINTSNFIVAFLTSITGLLGSLSQLRGSQLIKKGPRKKLVLKTVLFESLIWIPLIITAILYTKNLYMPILPFIVLLFFALFVIFSNLSYPAWFSWMGDLVDKKFRGKFFSKRNLIVGFVSVILTITSAYFLDYAKTKGFLMQGFMILFALAFIARFLSFSALRKQYEPKIKMKKADYFSFWEFTKNAHKNNFGRLSIYRFFLTITNNISSSLIAIYLLRNLSLSYFMYMGIIVSVSIFSLILVELWGKFSDKYGNYKAIEISSIFLAILPFLWILNKNPLYLLLVPAAVNGIAWAGFHLAEVNFIYDNVRPDKRGLAVSYYNTFSGIGIFIGATVGAILIKFITINFMEPIIAIFILGGVLRLIVVAIGIPKIREIRKTQKFRGIESIKDLILKEAKPTIYEETMDIIHIGKYLKRK